MKAKLLLLLCTMKAFCSKSTTTVSVTGVWSLRIEPLLLLVSGV